VRRPVQRSKFKGPTYFDFCVFGLTLALIGSSGPTKEVLKFKWSGVAEGVKSLPLRYKTVVQSEEEVEANISRLLQYYADKGRPFTKIRPKNFFRKADTIIYDLVIEEGPEVWIREISFTGEVQTNQALLRRIFSFPSEFIFSEKVVTNRIKRATQDLGSRLEFQGLELLPAQGGNYHLKIHIKEKTSQEISFLAGFRPRGKELSGFLSLAFPNLFYTQRNLSAKWRKDLARVEYLLSYTEPFLLFTRKTILSFTHKTDDTLSAKTAWQVQLAMRTGQEFLTFSFLVGGEKIQEFKQEGISFSYLGQEVRWDTREGRPAQRGFLFSFLSYAGTKKANPLLSRKMKSGVKIKGQTFFSCHRMILALSFLGEGVFSDTVRESEMTFLGGRERLRGFREEEFPARLVFLSRQELRFPIGSNFFFPFFDWGVKRKESTFEGHTSYGLGLELFFKELLLELAYGVGDWGNILSGKIHLLTKIAL